ncbi:hypothetical protein JMUB7529_28430 [Staphylococcus aureus]
MSRGLGDVYKRQLMTWFIQYPAPSSKSVSYTHLTLPTKA